MWRVNLLERQTVYATGHSTMEKGWERDVFFYCLRDLVKAHSVSAIMLWYYLRNKLFQRPLMTTVILVIVVLLVMYDLACAPWLFLKARNGSLEVLV